MVGRHVACRRECAPCLFGGYFGAWVCKRGGWSALLPLRCAGVERSPKITAAESNNVRGGFPAILAMQGDRSNSVAGLCIFQCRGVGTRFVRGNLSVSTFCLLCVDGRFRVYGFLRAWSRRKSETMLPVSRCGDEGHREMIPASASHGWCVNKAHRKRRVCVWRRSYSKSYGHKSSTRKGLEWLVPRSSMRTRDHKVNVFR